VLALFAEGIAGHAVHIKSLAEFTGEDALADGGGFDDGVNAHHDGGSVYLPEAIEHSPDEALNRGIYRLAVLDELGFREFGTYRFSMATARRRLPVLANREPESLGLRDSDLGIFFRCFEQPILARVLFLVIETARVRLAVGRRYPGTTRYRCVLQGHLEGRRTSLSGPLPEVARLEAALLGLDVASRLLPFAAPVLDPDADVYDSAQATANCLDALGPDLCVPGRVTGPGDDTPLEWLQREVRLGDWDEELAGIESEVAAMEFAELAAGDEEAETRSDDGDLREVGVGLVAERDQLKRRIDMERSSLRRALGDDRANAASFRYDEWDYHNGIYLPGWCRLYEERLHAADGTETGKLVDAVRPYVRSARRQFEQVRPTGYQRVKKTPDGDELDLDAIVAARIDVLNGASPDERVYSRRERLRRDIGAALLVDLSASTDDVIPEDEAHASTAPQDGKTQDIRDPFFDEDYDFAARMAEEAAKRRIIDILRESVLLLGAALESLGDRYGVYGFSGYGRDCVEFYVAKEFDDPLDHRALDAIAAMKPKRSTRMGPAVRHAVTKLEASGAALRVLMIVSDGFPQDHDYGPDRGQHEYGLEDTARALAEAEAQGIQTFCVTVDRSGHDYLRRMCPEDTYLVIEETAELPEALQKAYRQLTRT